MFTGEYRHTVDEKGRIAVPARFRVELGAGAMLVSWIDPCIAIFPIPAWQELATKVAALPVADPNARQFQRKVFGRAFDVELDRQGRFVLPTVLRQEIGLDGDAVVVGSRDHAEIWTPAGWDEYRRDLDDPQAFARAIAGLGI